MKVQKRQIRLRPQGLPERLPSGERVLWQGSPAMRTLLYRAFHIRGLVVYFSAILILPLVSGWRSGEGGLEMAASSLPRMALACVPVLLVALYAWAIRRTTIYSITNRRVVISFGMALPMSFNIPFSRIQSAGLRLYPDGGGDIVMRLLRDERMSYFALWPHVRAWRLGRAEPMLRCVAGAAEASDVLGRALADAQDLPHTAPQAVEPRQPRQVELSAARTMAA